MSPPTPVVHLADVQLIPASSESSSRVEPVPTLSALEAQLTPLRPSRAPDTASSTPRARAGRWLTVAGLLLAACKTGDGLLLPSEGEPAAIEIVLGNGQSGRVGEPLADPLVVEVTDTRNRPVEGASVTFELTSAGPGADIVPHTATTDANGQANAQIVLGTTIGRQAGEARVVMDARALAPKASFTAMAVSENANSMAAVAGEDQNGHVSAPLDKRLVVQVTDTFGNPINPGVMWEEPLTCPARKHAPPTNDCGRSSVDGERPAMSSANQPSRSSAPISTKRFLADTSSYTTSM